MPLTSIKKLSAKINQRNTFTKAAKNVNYFFINYYFSSCSKHSFCILKCIKKRFSTAAGSYIFLFHLAGKSETDIFLWLALLSRCWCLFSVGPDWLHHSSQGLQRGADPLKLKLMNSSYIGDQITSVFSIFKNVFNVMNMQRSPEVISQSNYHNYLSRDSLDSSSFGNSHVWFP